MSFAPATNALIEGWLRRMNTAAPGVVLECIGRRAKVQPADMTVYDDGAPPTSKPPILDVPVVSPGMQVRLTTGDPVLLIFTQRGASRFKSTFAEGPPDRIGFFSAKDAFAIPLGTTSDELPDGVDVRLDGVVDVAAGLRPGSLTEVARDALTPPAGTLIWNATGARLEVYDGTGWRSVDTSPPPRLEFMALSGGNEHPTAISVASDGRIYVSDYNDDRIYRYDGWGATSPDVKDVLDDPSGMAVAPDGTIYVLCRTANRLCRYTDWDDDTPDEKTLGLNDPQGVALDADGRIYVVDAHWDRVYRYADWSDTSPDQKSTSGTGIGHPRGVAIYGDDVYITDVNDDRIYRFTSWSDTTADSMNLASDNVPGGLGIDVDAGGRIYVVDNTHDRVARFRGWGV